MSSRNNKQQPVKKPFCKVCQDAGKSESEYTSHYVRSLPDRMGKTKVTCPTLLATECRYCYELGHTTKFCPVIAANKKAEERAFRLADLKQAEDKKKAVKTVEKTPARGGFAALLESSDSEEEPKVSTTVSKVVEEFPALSAVAAPSAPAKLSGWATVAAKSQAEYENEKYQQELIAKSIKRQLPPAAKKSWVVRLPEAKKSWADWSDSEDEEEEEEVYKPPLKASEMDWAATEESDDDW
jgi:hypothetical protein